MNKKSVISHVITLLLGLLGGFLGKDLSMFQKPVEAVVEKATVTAGPPVVVSGPDAGP